MHLGRGIKFIYFIKTIFSTERSTSINLRRKKVKTNAQNLITIIDNFFMVVNAVLKTFKMSLKFNQLRPI